MKLLFALLIGLVLAFCGLYALTTLRADEPTVHPAIDEDSRSKLLEELKRDESAQ